MSDRLVHIVVPEAAQQSHFITAEFLLDNKSHPIFFRSNGETILTGSNESFVASGLLPCMKTGGGILVSEGEISQKFFSSLLTIQDIYCKWDSALSRTEVKGVTPVTRSGAFKNRVGTFFSGGVDSFYTFLKHQYEITDLIFVHGLDIKLSNTLLREKVSKKIHEVAASFGVAVLEIETNIRNFLNSYVDWGLLGHGAALAAIGHLLSPHFRRIYIPASHTYTDLFPWGSHPILDPLWSSENLEFIHDGCEATRVEKVSLISKYDIALQSLRVCWKNPNSSYNCGRCEKCIRTMINLKVNDALHRCTTFDQELDISNILKLTANDENTRAFIKENLKALQQNSVDPTLEKALQQILSQPSWSHKLKKRLKTSISSLIKQFT